VAFEERTTELESADKETKEAAIALATKKVASTAKKVAEEEKRVLNKAQRAQRALLKAEKKAEKEKKKQAEKQIEEESSRVKAAECAPNRRKRTRVVSSSAGPRTPDRRKSACMIETTPGIGCRRQWV
jgi:outer membrane PBP1 activator LpoA protein